MEVTNIFRRFQFSELDENWVKSVLKTDLTTFEKPPDECLMFLESPEMRQLLQESHCLVKTWIVANQDPGTCNSNLDLSWEKIVLQGIKIQTLLTVFGYIMKLGQSNDADEDARQACLNATGLYFMFLAMPGSSTFNVFHPNIYELALGTFKLPTYLFSVERFNFKSVNSDTRSNRTRVLATNLNNIINDFILMLKTFWLKYHAQSLDMSVKALLELTQNKLTYMSENSSQNEGSTVLVRETAFTALQKLCNSNHGPINNTIRLIAKYVLLYFLENHTDGPPKFVAGVRDSTMYFLRNILTLHQTEAECAFIIFAQHMMVTYPDRAEARQRQASILVKFLTICNYTVIQKALQNLICLSHHSKIANRIFAQEIIGKILIEQVLKECTVLTSSERTRLERTLFATVLSRCFDCSNIVRGKAMATIAEYSDSNNNENEAMIFDSIFAATNSDMPLPTFEELKNSMSTDINPLPGLNTFISLLMSRVEDERVFVRRSVLQIFGNLAPKSTSLMENAVTVISYRCRDPAITVRRFAVQVLSQLLEKFPNNSHILTIWVRTVVPQIFDIEIKVQEKVLEYLQEFLLCKIQHFSTSNNSKVQDLPWKILTELTRVKMRKHLSKACSIWVKNQIVTKSMIEKIESHIGTDNDTVAWVFLAALAESTKLPNVQKYVANYKEFIRNNDFHASLVLHVLYMSWTSLDYSVLGPLCDYLLVQLREFQISFGLIGVCLDIVNVISEFLNPEMEKSIRERNMSNLINDSEKEIGKILKNDDITVEVRPNYLRAMFTLGHATLYCTRAISSQTLRILQGILVEWNALPNAINEIEELQATAIIVLGQQAIRDREIAQEVVPIFGKLLRQEIGTDSLKRVGVKVNTAKVLADVCMRFTALVEPYLFDMCMSMKHENPQVREAIIIVFVQLLLEDFIKIKGPFFFHVLTMLSDPDDTIRELTVYLIEERLLVKNKNLISQQFLEGIYHYNNYEYRHKNCLRKNRNKNRNTLTLPGKRNQSKRRTIYDFMLEHLDPPGKIKLLVKLTSQILGGVCTDSIDITTEEGACVLTDALYILHNERLQPSSLTKQVEDPQEQEESTTQASSPSANAINVIVEGMRKHGIDCLLPTLVGLKNKLSSLNTALGTDLKKLLVKTYSLYNKDQLLTLLTEYPNLEKEIEEHQRQIEMENCVESRTTEESQQHLSTPLTDGKYSSSPSVILHRLSPSELLHWTGSPVLPRVSNIEKSVTNSVDCWDVLQISNSLREHSPLIHGCGSSTPKSHRCSNRKDKRFSPLFRRMSKNCISEETRKNSESENESKA